MKKQILFLAFFTLALIFAGTISSFGQSYKTNDPLGWTAPTCGAGDLYHPAVGEDYDYTVTIPATSGYTGTGTYAWKVVTGAAPLNLLTATDVGSTIYTVDGPTDAANINITWLPASSGNNYYLVIEYNEENATNAAGDVCDINNVKVYPIAPRNVFWLDINASTTSAATDIAATTLAAFNVCAPQVSAANIIVGGDIDAAEVTYEYGVTTLYSVIHSAGYTGDFQADIVVSGLAGSQTAVVTGWTAGTVDANGNGNYTKDVTTALAGADEVVELVITNNQHENLADQLITISVDGSYTVGGVTVNDLTDVTTECSEEADHADGVVQTVTARPTVNPTNPAAFVDENPALD